MYAEACIQIDKVKHMYRTSHVPNVGKRIRATCEFDYYDKSDCGVHHGLSDKHEILNLSLWRHHYEETTSILEV